MCRWSQTGQAVLCGQCCLGFIEQVEAIRAEAVDHQREEAFAVRLLMQRLPAI
jgi:hypothetical protein